ncbi:hypothetical protein ACOME3_005775 [Neoechinorhynchus agilis]
MTLTLSRFPKFQIPQGNRHSLHDLTKSSIPHQRTSYKKNTGVTLGNRVNRLQSQWSKSLDKFEIIYVPAVLRFASRQRLLIGGRLCYIISHGRSSKNWNRNTLIFPFIFIFHRLLFFLALHTTQMEPSRLFLVHFLAWTSLTAPTVLENPYES